MVDISELLANEVCKDDNARLSFFIKLLNKLKGFSHLDQRLSKSQYILFNYLSDDYKQNLPNSFQVFKDNIDFSIIEDENLDRKIGIYTLQEKAGIRAKEIINQVYPNLKITINSDKNCTDRLKSLSKNSEILVFAWKSSKHQAFYCIKENRNDNLKLLQPLGKGSASIVSEVFNHL